MLFWIDKCCLYLYSWFFLFGPRCHTLFPENEYWFPQDRRFSWYSHFYSFFVRIILYSVFCWDSFPSCLLISFRWLQQLEQYFLQQILFAPCRYKWHWSCGTYYDLQERYFRVIHSICAGAQSGWDTFAVQFGFRGRRSKWCHISGAFQCNPELWPVSHRLKNCFAIYWKLFVSLYLKHHAGSISKSLSGRMCILWLCSI